MRILGIDPGYATLGWGVIDYNANRFKVVECGAVITKSGLDFPKRLEQIYDGVCDNLARLTLPRLTTSIFSMIGECTGHVFSTPTPLRPSAWRRQGVLCFYRRERAGFRCLSTHRYRSSSRLWGTAGQKKSRLWK